MARPINTEHTFSLHAKSARLDLIERNNRLIELPDSIEFNGDTSQQVEIGVEGGASLNGPTISPVRFNNGLNYLDALARTYITRNGLEDPDAGGVVVIGESGQEVFQAGAGFEGATFAEFIMNDAMDAAILMVAQDGEVRTYNVPGDRFVAMPDGSAARFFGGVDDFARNDVDFGGDSSALESEFQGYLASVDRILSTIG